MGALPVKFSHNYNLNTFVQHRSLPRVSYARTFYKLMNAKLLRLTWIDQITSEPKKTADFYSELLGFEQVEVAEPNDCTSYAMTNDEGEEVLGIVDETNFPNWATGWVAYFEVEDIEQSCRRAQELGAEITMRGTGQCLVKDPAGSPIVLLQSPQEKD